MTLIHQALEFVRTVFAVKSFLREQVTAEDGSRLTRELLGRRAESFLTVLAGAVYANPHSSYLRLLQHAGIALEDVRRDVEQNGLEAALETLYSRGIFITVDEFKGRAPIRRDGIEIPLEDVDLSNPLAGDFLGASTGGSRGLAAYERRTFDRLVVDAGSNAFFFEARDWLRRPWAEWRQGDMYWPIFYGKLGKKLSRSFSSLDFGVKALGRRKHYSERLKRFVASLVGIPVKWPEYVPPAEAAVIAHWLADQKAKGTPGMIHAFSSSALRICQAAQEEDLDIAGTAMAVTGEPFTAAKARFIAEAGVEVDTKYTAVEFGSLGRGCQAPIDVDEVHLNADKVALIQASRLVEGFEVSGLFFTGVLSSFPKVMLNLEIGDYANVFERDCGCPAEQLGLTTHISGIRSYEKLTSEGVTFLGGELIDLLEEKLPARFGGQAGDYQLVEEEDEGTSRIKIVISPGVGPVDDTAVVKTVLEVLASDAFGGRRRMGELWRDSDTLRVVRQEVVRTGRAKVLPLHSLAATRLNQSSTGESVVRHP